MTLFSIDDTEGLFEHPPKGVDGGTPKKNGGLQVQQCWNQVCESTSQLSDFHRPPPRS